MTHSHRLVDSDRHLIIDPVTRKITNPTANKTILMQYDLNSEVFGFDIPRHVDGHDMGKSDLIEIHYINASGMANKVNRGVYVVDDVETSDDTVSFSWLISGDVTAFAGSLSFAVRFICKDGDKIIYSWGTDIYNGISIRSSIKNSN